MWPRLSLRSKHMLPSMACSSHCAFSVHGSRCHELRFTCPLRVRSLSITLSWLYVQDCRCPQLHFEHLLRVGTNHSHCLSMCRDLHDFFVFVEAISQPHERHFIFISLSSSVQDSCCPFASLCLSPKHRLQVFQAQAQGDTNSSTPPSEQRGALDES